MCMHAWGWGGRARRIGLDPAAKCFQRVRASDDLKDMANNKGLWVMGMRPCSTHDAHVVWLSPGGGDATKRSIVSAHGLAKSHAKHELNTQAYSPTHPCRSPCLSSHPRPQLLAINSPPEPDLALPPSPVRPSIAPHRHAHVFLPPFSPLQSPARHGRAPQQGPAAGRMRPERQPLPSVRSTPPSSAESLGPAMLGLRKM